MLLILGGIVGLAVAAALVSLFVRWEREGNPQLAPLVLLGLLVVEGTLYAGPDGIPRGLFHPGSGSTQLRLPEIYITLALIARLIARGRPKRIGLPAALWLVFMVCLFVGMAEGILYHNEFSQNIYEAKAIIYIGGAYALAAGVPVRRYYDRGDLFRLGTLCVVCATLLDLMTFAGVSINTTVPLLPLQGFGQIGNESAAIFMAVVTMSFLARLASGPTRLRHVLALIPVVVSVVLAQERAVLVNLGVVFLVVVAAVIVRSWRGLGRRFHVRSGQVAVALLSVVALLIAIVVVPAAVDRRPVQIPLASSYENLFHNEAKGGIGTRPPEPGVGGRIADPPAPLHRLGPGGAFSVLRSRGAHSRAESVRTRLRARPLAPAGPHRSPELPRCAAGPRSRRGSGCGEDIPIPWWPAWPWRCVAVVAGLIATGLLEPMLDEYRFVTLFGVSLGMLRACATSLDSRRRPLTWHMEAVGSDPWSGGRRWTL